MVFWSFYLVFFLFCFLWGGGGLINLRGVDTFEHLSGISVILKVLRVFYQ